MAGTSKNENAVQPTDIHHDSEYCFTPEHKVLSGVRKEFGEDWKHVGLGLKLKNNVLNIIELDSQRYEVRAFNMLCEWMKRDATPCYCKLISAMNEQDLSSGVVTLKEKIKPKSPTSPMLVPPLDTIGLAKPKGNETAKAPDSLSTEDSTDVEDLPCYEMKSKPRGIGVIINNKKFPITSPLNDRNGTDIDAAALEKLFKNLGFNTVCHNNLTASKMRDKLKEVAAVDHKNFDCLLIAILTHGVEGKLYGSDAKLIPVEDLTRLFYGDQCPSLIGKPKIFFLQACRGEAKDSGVEYDTTDGGVDKAMDYHEASEEQCDYINANMFAKEADETDSRGILPTKSDCLLAYATIPGYVSWRRPQSGSWFVSVLIKIFEERADTEHLIDMLTEVNRRVTDEYESSSGKKKQMPEPVTSLRKKLYFHPRK